MSIAFDKARSNTRKRRSRTLSSRTPRTKRSHRISSGVISSCSSWQSHAAQSRTSTFACLLFVPIVETISFVNYLCAGFAIFIKIGLHILNTIFLLSFAPDKRIKYAFTASSPMTASNFDTRRPRTRSSCL